LLDSITEIIDGEEERITIRHLFYRLVGLRVIDKTESDYTRLCAHLSKWRKQGKVPWGAFTDSTRWYTGSRCYDSMQQALQNTVAAYRRNLWAAQPYHAEVWVEKDAINGIVSDVADSFGVRTFVCRGFTSLTSLFNAAETFRAQQATGKCVVVFHLGDWDPSGQSAREHIDRTLRDEFGLEIDIRQLAVTPTQIADWELPTRPVKMSDRRAKAWTGGDCVELDTINSTRLKELVSGAITDLIEPRAWEELQQAEAMERETLRALIRKAA